MDNNRFDLLEILFKNKLGITLTESEKKHLDTIDSDTRNTIYELIDSGAYVDELISTLDNIIKKSKNSPKVQQEDIIYKCEEAKQHLLYGSVDNHQDKYRQVK